jgi:hypothetical protein
VFEFDDEKIYKLDEAQENFDTWNIALAADAEGQYLRAFNLRFDQRTQSVYMTES